ncbi:MAG: tRNA (adenosine(37)-N6)-threonylcarbamoyltransferase complex dimerization subunit type 1 TsaB [Acidimicrobiia bacterium]|nr:tRNA (adenosine(37)-N6)-threonylcarbamoyltransferase complex dimerization subunit type 1 TsaB [Acidimicrobiia bacterium]
MFILGMDTATSQVGVAIGDSADGGGVLAEVLIAGDRRHAEQLAPAIQHVCDESGVRLDQLGAIAVGIGPGLFTGLRVGVTTAKVMAQALGIPVVSASSLDLIAAPPALLEEGHAHALVVPVIDARRREVFSARYRVVPGGVQREGDYTVGSVEDLIADLQAGSEHVLLAGDGVTRYREQFAGLDRSEMAGPEFEYPSVAALVQLAAGRVEREEFVQPWDVHPMYLRESDAELHWETPR